MFASTFVLLYVGHMIADYPLQIDWQASCKAEKSAVGWLANLTHAGTHVAVCAATLGLGAVVLDLGLSPTAAAIALAWIGLSHSIIDRRGGVLAWMRIARQTKFQERGGAVPVDQAAHITAVVIAALALSVA